MGTTFYREQGVGTKKSGENNRCRIVPSWIRGRRCHCTAFFADNACHLRSLKEPLVEFPRRKRYVNTSEDK